MPGLSLIFEVAREMKKKVAREKQFYCNTALLLMPDTAQGKVCISLFFSFFFCVLCHLLDRIRFGYRNMQTCTSKNFEPTILETYM